MADTTLNPTLTEASTTSSPNASLLSPSPSHLTTTSIDNHPLQITQHKLNGSNFREWSQLIILVIKGKGKSGYLTGSIPAPPATTANYGLWEAENSTIMAWLINSMEPKIGRTYLFYKTAKEVWESVQEMYSDLEDFSQCFEVRSAIRNTKQGMNSVTEYFNVLVGLWHEMDMFYAITWESPTDSTQYNKMIERERIFDFLYGLNPDLDEVRGRILGTKPLLSLKEVFSEERKTTKEK